MIDFCSKTKGQYSPHIFILVLGCDCFIVELVEGMKLTVDRKLLNHQKMWSFSQL